MITPNLSKKIISFCQEEPRSIAEIATEIGKSWKTTDKYVSLIKEESDLLEIKVFRKGSHGALKVVYSNNQPSKEGTKSSFEQMILMGREKKDFSPMELFHFTDKNLRQGFIVSADENKLFEEALRKVKNRIYFFSGNLSWLDENYISILEDLTLKGIEIKILTRIDLSSTEKVKQILSLNKKFAEDRIGIRHRSQPLRGAIFDNQKIFLREENIEEAKDGMKEVLMQYILSEPKWCRWLERVFMKMWFESIPAYERLEALKEIQTRTL